MIDEEFLKPGRRIKYHKKRTMTEARYGIILRVNKTYVKIRHGHNGFKGWIPRTCIIGRVLPRLWSEKPFTPLPKVVLGVADRLLASVLRSPFPMRTIKNRQQRSRNLWKVLLLASRTVHAKPDWKTLLAELTNTDLEHLKGIFNVRGNRARDKGRCTPRYLRYERIVKVLYKERLRRLRIERKTK